MKRAIALGLLWVVFCVLAFFPARWAGTFMPNSAKAVVPVSSINGTIWNGDAKIILPRTTWPMSAQYKLSPLKAISGGSFLDAVFSGQGLSAKGQFGFKNAQDVTARLNLNYLPISDPRLVGVQGDVVVTLDDLKISDRCDMAQGQVRTNMLAANEARWKWAGPILSGPISCDGDALLMTISGKDQDHDIKVDLRLYIEGRYDLDMRVNPIGVPQIGFEFVMSAMGFEEQPDGSSRLREQGQIFQGARG